MHKKQRWSREKRQGEMEFKNPCFKSSFSLRHSREGRRFCSWYWTFSDGEEAMSCRGISLCSVKWEESYLLNGVQIGSLRLGQYLPGEKSKRNTELTEQWWWHRMGQVTRLLEAFHQNSLTSKENVYIFLSWFALILWFFMEHSRENRDK